MLVGESEADEGDEVGADDGLVLLGELEVVFADAADLEGGGRVVVGDADGAAEGNLVPEEVGVADAEGDVGADRGLEVESAADAEFAGALRDEGFRVRGGGEGGGDAGGEGEGFYLSDPTPPP